MAALAVRSETGRPGDDRPALRDRESPTNSSIRRLVGQAITAFDGSRGGPPAKPPIQLEYTRHSAEPAARVGMIACALTDCVTS